jgi:hypothetical protein
MFAAAFLAMRTVRLLPVFSSPAEVAPPTIIRFEPPAPRPIPKPQPRVTTATPSTTVAPTSVPIGIAPANTAATAAPVSAAPPDSSVGAPKSRITDIPPVSPLKPPAAIENARGAVMGTAGVTGIFRPLTDAERDSIANVMMARMMAEVKRPLTKDEKKALKDLTEPGHGMENTRAGSDGKVVPLMNGGVSVAKVPLISLPVGGKSAAERKREATIDSTNRAILYRLQDRARLLRDSLRADSLRRDSLKRIRP